MTVEEFRNTLENDNPDAMWTEALKALWYDGKGDWDGAHTLIQDAMGGDQAWVHAFLHRKEGDTWNADYWYRRAGRKRPDVSLEQEWADIVHELLN